MKSKPASELFDNSPEPLWSSKTVAEYLDISVGTVWNYVYTGKLKPFKRLGKGKRAPLRFRKSDIDAALLADA